MRNYHALALLLLLGALSADFTLYLSPASSAFKISAEKAAFPGHYGNYTVQVGVFPHPPTIAVSGEGADADALAKEVAWLRQNGLLVTSCNLTGLRNYSEPAYCDDSGKLVACSSSSACQPQPVPPAAPEAEGGFGKALTLPAAAPMMQRVGEREAQDNAAASGTGLEQVLPLVAAFLAVIIASYLILQQRQVQIEPQEERLLENETRAGIMQELSLADKIPTDLSARLGKSKATIVEHLEALLQAGFVEKLETPGKKFVFYRLTRKGKQALLRQAG